MSAKILLVDDDHGLLRLLTMRLRSAGFMIDTATDGQTCLELIDIVQPDLIISDLKMDSMDGLNLFHEVHARRPFLPFILITAHGTIPDAVAAMQEGVFSFIPKPIDTEKLLEVIRSALRRSGSVPLDSKRRANNQSAGHTEIITQNPEMIDLLKQVKVVARSQANVLIMGESGTGKELLARAVHESSQRNDGPFVGVNCAAIPADLLESELFGHVKGAFTGAARDRKGLFHAATGGTLFLDEIGDMPSNLQSKLLRVLEERLVRPVGSSQSWKADARIIAATHQNLLKMVEQGSFRQDLFYRLNVIQLTIPTLDKRSDDIPLLANSFLERAIERHNLRAISFAPRAVEQLSVAKWPGNIRQLANTVERLAVLNQSGIITEKSVLEALGGQQKQLPSLAEAKSEFERDYLISILRQTGGNVTKAARSAQRNRTDFYKLMARHNIQPSLFKDQPSRKVGV